MPSQVGTMLALNHLVWFTAALHVACVRVSLLLIRASRCAADYCVQATPPHLPGWWLQLQMRKACHHRYRVMIWLPCPSPFLVMPDRPGQPWVYETIGIRGIHGVFLISGFWHWAIQVISPKPASIGTQALWTYDFVENMPETRQRCRYWRRVFLSCRIWRLLLQRYHMCRMTWGTPFARGCGDCCSAIAMVNPTPQVSIQEFGLWTLCTDLLGISLLIVIPTTWRGGASARKRPLA